MKDAIVLKPAGGQERFITAGKPSKRPLFHGLTQPHHITASRTFLSYLEPWFLLLLWDGYNPSSPRALHLDLTTTWNVPALVNSENYGGIKTSTKSR